MKFLYSITILLLFSTCILLYIGNKNLEKESLSQLEQMGNMRKNFLLNITNRCSFPVTKNLEVLDMNMNMIDIKYIIGNQPKVIFRFTDQACGKCISDFIKLINNFSGKSSYNIVFLVSSKNPKYLFEFGITLNKSISIYRIDYSVLGTPYESTDIPYFFIISPDLNMSDFFIPDSNDSVLVKEYINKLNISPI